MKQHAKPQASPTRLVSRAFLAAAFALPAAGQGSIGGFEPPEGWFPPPLAPTGVRLRTHELGPGVYALLSDRPPVDNSGFVVGERGVLVIDAHINAEMAGQIIAAVREVTEKPILYLVNTNAHGDHTFGNHAFPPGTTIVAHRKTAEAMRGFDEEKALMLSAVGGDESVLDGVEPRLPDVVFESSLRLDLGGRVVELHHFGHGNTPGDTVVYEPSSKVAWTGNLILGEKTIPWAIEGRLREYLETVARLARELDVETIVPGHAPPTRETVASEYLRYLSWLLDAVRARLRAGASLERTLADLPLDESFLPASDSPLARARPLMEGFHRWNVKRAYQELEAESPVAAR